MKLLAALALTCLTFTAAAQSMQDCQTGDKKSVTIEGRITNSNGEPAAGAKVKVTDHGCFKSATTTDAYGTYKLKLKDGDYEVTVLYNSGLQDSKELTNTRTGERIKLDFDERRAKTKSKIENREVLDEDEEVLN